MFFLILSSSKENVTEKISFSMESNFTLLGMRQVKKTSEELFSRILPHHSHLQC